MGKEEVQLLNWLLDNNFLVREALQGRAYRLKDHAAVMLKTAEQLQAGTLDEGVAGMFAPGEAGMMAARQLAEQYAHNADAAWASCEKLESLLDELRATE